MWLAGVRVPEHGPVELLEVAAALAEVEVGLRDWWGVCGWAGSLPFRVSWRLTSVAADAYDPRS